MKKSILLISYVFTIGLLSACHSQMDYATPSTDDINVSLTPLTKSEVKASFSFDPIIQDSAWRYNENTAERIAALQIPENQLAYLSTTELVKLCMDYPFFIHALTFNSVEEGIRIVKSRFNGFGELEKRQDAGNKLLSYYAQVDMTDVANDAVLQTIKKISIPHLIYIEHVLHSMAPLFSTEEMQQLLAMAAEKEAIKNFRPDLFSENSRNVLLSQNQTRAGEYVLSYTNIPLLYGYTMEGINRSPDYTTWEQIQIAAEILIAHPLVTILAPATVTYNCHSYAWNMTEFVDSQGSPLYTTWINFFKSDDTPNVSLNWTIGRFEPASSSSSHFRKIFYSQGDHSAVKSSVTGKYESKWGTFPLVRHSPTDCPYVSTDLIYYKDFVSTRPLYCSGSDMELQMNQNYLFYSTNVSSEPFVSSTWHVYESKNGDDVTGIWAEVSNPSYSSSAYSAYVTFSHQGLYYVELEITRSGYHSVSYGIEVYVEPSI